MADISSGLAYVAIILFFIIALPRGDRSLLGQVGLMVDDFLTDFLGTREMARCPFLRRGMLIHQFTKYDYPVKVYACQGECRINCETGECEGDCGEYEADEITAYESSLIKVPVGQKPSCDLDNFINFEDPEAELLKCRSSKNCDGETTASAFCGEDSARLTVCLKCDDGPCKCEDEYGLMEECDLDEFVVNTFLSPQAEKERDLFALMGSEMPPWVCYVVFGIFPFTLIYFLVQDILHFTPLRTSTKRAVALVVGMMGIFSGAFVGITMGIIKFMKLTTGQATLFLIFGTAILVSFMFVFQTFLRPALIYGTQARKLKYSIKALKGIYRDMAEEDRKTAEPP